MSDQYCSEHDFYYNANHIIDVVCPWCEIDRLTAMLAESNAEIKLQKNPHRYNVMKQSIASQKRRMQELKDDIDLMKERLAASQQEVERLKEEIRHYEDQGLGIPERSEQAHCKGWEQCKREAKRLILDNFACSDYPRCDHDWCGSLVEITDTIASMEYKEAQDDKQP